jgi:hypothetical protein
MRCSLSDLTNSLSQGIASVAYLMTSQFAYGFYNSCKDVQVNIALNHCFFWRADRVTFMFQFPSGNSKMLTAICGRSAQTCTVFDLLAFLGSISNGQVCKPS